MIPANTSADVSAAFERARKAQSSWADRPISERAEALDVEPAVLPYFVHPTSYTCQKAIRDLRGSGVFCPAFESYVDSLVAFVREHPEISSDAMT